MRARTLVGLALAAALAAGTILGGWWTVPVLAGLFGLFAAGRLRRAPATAGLAAAVAWAALLAVDAAGTRFGALAAALAAALTLPAALILAVTLGFAALLAWSAATLGAALSRHERRRTVAPPEPAAVRAATPAGDGEAAQRPSAAPPAGAGARR